MIIVPSNVAAKPLVYAPPVFDSAGSGASGTTTPSWYHYPAASSKVLVFASGMALSGSPSFSATYGGVSMGAALFTQAFMYGATYNMGLAVFAVDTGATGQIIVTVTNGYAAGCYATSLSYTGVDSIVDVTGAGASSSSTATQTVTSADGEVIAQAFGNYAGIASYNQTSRSHLSYLWAGEAPGASSVTFNGGSSNGWGSAAVRLLGKWVEDMGTPTKFTGVTYTQSSVYSTCVAADYTYMNNGNANGSTNNAETGTNGGAGQYVQANAGSSRYIDHIVLGYDYLSNLPGGFGVGFTNGCAIQGSNDGSSWTTITTAPTYASGGSSNGLVSINIKQTWQYIRIASMVSSYVAVLELELWGT